MKTTITLFLFIIVGVSCFLVGRSTVKIETKMIYSYENSIQDSLPQESLKPIKEKIPQIPILQMKTDTVWRDSIHTEIKYIYSKVDTAAIIEDYILQREYALTLFDNEETGKMDIFPKVQYNKLMGLSYDFTPVIRTETISNEKTLIPFLSGSYSTSGYLGVGGGVFYHNLGLEYQYQLKPTDISYNAHMFGLKVKF